MVSSSHQFQRKKLSTKATKKYRKCPQPANDDNEMTSWNQSSLERAFFSFVSDKVIVSHLPFSFHFVSDVIVSKPAFFSLCIRRSNCDDVYWYYSPPLVLVPQISRRAIGMTCIPYTRRITALTPQLTVTVTFIGHRRHLLLPNLEYDVYTSLQKKTAEVCRIPNYSTTRGVRTPVTWDEPSLWWYNRRTSCRLTVV